MFELHALFGDLLDLQVEEEGRLEGVDAAPQDVAEGLEAGPELEMSVHGFTELLQHPHLFGPLHLLPEGLLAEQVFLSGRGRADEDRLKAVLAPQVVLHPQADEVEDLWGGELPRQENQESRLVNDPFSIAEQVLALGEHSEPADGLDGRPDGRRRTGLEAGLQALELPLQVHLFVLEGGEGGVGSGGAEEVDGLVGAGEALPGEVAEGVFDGGLGLVEDGESSCSHLPRQQGVVNDEAKVVHAPIKLGPSTL